MANVEGGVGGTPAGAQPKAPPSASASSTAATGPEPSPTGCSPLGPGEYHGAAPSVAFAAATVSVESSTCAAVVKGKTSSKVKVTRIDVFAMSVVPRPPRLRRRVLGGSFGPKTVGAEAPPTHTAPVRRTVAGATPAAMENPLRSSTPSSDELSSVVAHHGSVSRTRADGGEGVGDGDAPKESDCDSERDLESDSVVEGDGGGVTSGHDAAEEALATDDGVAVAVPLRSVVVVRVGIPEG